MTTVYLFSFNTVLQLWGLINYILNSVSDPKFTCLYSKQCFCLSNISKFALVSIYCIYISNYVLWFRMNTISLYISSYAIWFRMATVSISLTMLYGLERLLYLTMLYGLEWLLYLYLYL